jgi:hypothetical protein
MGINIIIGWQKFETDFQGQKVSMEVRPLKRWAWFVLQPIFQKMPSKNKDETTEAYLERLTSDDMGRLTQGSADLQDASAKIFKDHVRNIEGITVNGEPVSFDVMAEEVVFMRLSIEICNKLMEISNIKDGEEKNSGGQSDLQKLEN